MKKLTPQDITLLFHQLATLIHAKIPILQCCDILEKSQSKLAARIFINTMRRDLLSGKSLSTIFNQYPHYFNAFICQLIRIGEHTGKLDHLLLTIAKHLDHQLVFKRKIKQALFYPTIIFCTGIIMTLCLFIFVIPQFAELFQQSNTTLPPLTSAIFYLANHLSNACIVSLIGGILIYCLLKYKKHSFHIPLLTHYQKKIILARFTQNIALTFGAGIPILDALRLSAATCTQQHFTRLIHQVITKIQSGIQLHRALAAYPFFPEQMIQLIKVGEQTGMLVEMLQKTSAFFEDDIEQFIQRFIQLLEPLIMLGLGVLIGGLVIGLYLPIFKLGNTL